MKLESLRVHNLRSIEDETIYFDDYTCLVGPNGSGKSTVFCALNIFFRNSTESPLNLLNPEKEDFHKCDVSKPIIITATFKDLNKEAQEDFKAYYRHGKLVITAIAEFDADNEEATVEQHGQRIGMEKFRKFFEAEKEGARVSELRDIYEYLKKEFTDLNTASTKQSMIDELKNYESSHPDDCDLILSKDDFYGFTKGSNLLAKHFQWIFVPAVKDASSEQLEAKNSALGKILTRTVRSKIDFETPLRKLLEDTKTNYENILKTYQSDLKILSDSLQERITEWAHPDANIKLEWQLDSQKTVRLDEPFAQIIAGEGDFFGNIARFGHGLQRSYLLALLQELSESNAEHSPTLLLGCEEPELYQHPPQSKHLASVLHKLSISNSQVIVTTHSPYFVLGKGFENVRLVRKHNVSCCTNINHVKFEDIDNKVSNARGEPIVHPEGILAKIHQSLQPSLSEMFFTTNLVLVEGLEDLAYLTSYFNLMDKYDEFRRLGIHIVPTHNKTNMILPYCIANELNIPTFIIFDSDNKPETDPDKRTKHEKDNKALLKLAGFEDPEPFPENTLWADSLVMWQTDIGAAIKSDFDPDYWETTCNRIRNKYANVRNLNKNCLFIADVLESAWNEENKSETLVTLCTKILDFAKN